MRNPIKNLNVAMYPKGDMTQPFGVNKALYAFMGLEGHNGEDYCRPHGEPMYATEDGTVVEVKDDPKGFGMHVRFVTDVPDEQGYYHEWTYGHCSATFVSINDKVFAGQKIANMGNTGFVVSGATPFWNKNPFSGTHLHLGLRLMKRPKRGGWFYPTSTVRLDVVNYNNGFKGAVDPAPYLIGANDGIKQPTIMELQLTVLSLLNKLYSILKK